MLIAGSFLVGCNKPVIEPAKPWDFYKESYFPTTIYKFDGKADYNKFKLGAALFYDPILSSDSTISCATCHAQTHAFAGHNTALSEGVGHALGNRNSPAIFNLAWSPAFMWDGGINHIEVMPIGPITNPVEMNETMANVIHKLQQSSRYKILFKEAFGTEEINDQRMLKAMAQYLCMIKSDQSKYDKVRKGQAVFTATEQAGYDLFLQKCNQCHTEPLFTDYTYRNNGLTPTASDSGRMHITLNAADRDKYKVPSLRNVEFTYPYMHDGRFFTLSMVLDHYNSGVTNSATLDQALSGGIPLNNAEKKQLIAFLKTLSDYELLSNTFYREPLK